VVYRVPVGETGVAPDPVVFAHSTLGADAAARAESFAISP